MRQQKEEARMVQVSRFSITPLQTAGRNKPDSRSFILEDFF